MTLTPWGESGKLRDQRLRPGPGIPRERVERNQRERLFGATVAVTTAKGYGRTSIANLVETAGVSRTTFYKYFADKEECFLATLDEIISTAIGVTASRVRGEGPWEERAVRGMASFVELLVAHPAAARLCLVETYAAGPEATKRIDQALAGFQELTDYAFEQLPEREGMPVEMTQAMVGGLRKLIHSHLHRHTEEELIDLVPGLTELALSYRPPPRPLRAPQRRRPALPMPSAEQRVEDPGSRIARATIEVIATKGYGETAVADIATAAGVSLRTFYEYFDGKEEALYNAFYGGRLRLLAAMLPTFERERDWPEAIRAAFDVALAFFESEPDFTRVATLEIYTAGPAALERLELALEAIQPFLEGGFERSPQVPAVARQAIPCTLYAVLCERVRTHGPEDLRELMPLATYIALAPFVGAEDACTVANGEKHSPGANAAQPDSRIPTPRHAR
jgi:AcrR family transcriptional regulator